MPFFSTYHRRCGFWLFLFAIIIKFNFVDAQVQRVPATLTIGNTGGGGTTFTAASGSGGGSTTRPNGPGSLTIQNLRYMEISITLNGQQLTTNEDQDVANLIVETYNSINCPNGIQNCNVLYLKSAKLIRSTVLPNRRRLEQRNLDAEICFLLWLYELAVGDCDNCNQNDPLFPDDSVANTKDPIQAVGTLTSGGGGGGRRSLMSASGSFAVTPPITRQSFVDTLVTRLRGTTTLTTARRRSIVPTQVREVLRTEVDSFLNNNSPPPPPPGPQIVSRPAVIQAPAPAPPPVAVFCFSGLDMVTTPQGQVPIKDLNLGDLVSNGIHFEQVYSFGHYLPASSKTHLNNAFLNIYTTNNAFSPALTVSKDHLIFIHNKNNNNNKDPLVLPASHIKVGDQLLVQTSASTSTPTALFVPTIVSRIEDVNVVPQGGIFAPFTPSGRILVNGILASNYVAHYLDNNNNKEKNGMSRLLLSFGSIDWLSHLFMTPRRLVCEINFEWCRNESYTNEGISTWVVPLRSFGKWFFGKEGQIDDDGDDGVSFVMTIQLMMMIFVKWMILMSIVGVMGVLHLLELYPSTMVVLSMTATALWLTQTHKAKKGKK